MPYFTDDIALLKAGIMNVDKQPEAEFCAHKRRRLSPNKCSERFHVKDNGELVNEHTHQELGVNEYCIDFNGNAESRDDHFAYVCEEGQLEEGHVGNSRFT